MGLLALKRLKTNNKGASKVAYGLLIALIIAISVFTVLVLIAKNMLPFRASKEVLCKTSNKWGTMFGGDLGTAVNPFGGFCSATNVIINPESWDKCDVSFKSGYFAASDDDGRTSWAKKCAAQQVLDLVISCYDIGGEGAWEPPSFMCYTFVIGLEGGLEATNDALENYANQVEKRITDKLTLAGEELLRKEELDELVGLAKKKQIYEMLIDWLTDVIWSKIDGCKFDSSVDALELTTQIVEGEANVVDVLTGAIDNTKKDERNDADCENIETSINEDLSTIVTYEEHIAEVDAELSSKLLEFGVPESVIDVEVAAEITGKTDRFSIDYSYLKKIADSTIIVGADKTYSAALRSSENYELLGGQDIERGGFYEIGYCNPPLALGSGIGVRIYCNMLTEGHQEVQIAPGGTGAGGQLRTGSPMPAYCNSLNAQTLGASDVILPDLLNPDKWCKSLLGSVGIQGAS